MRSPAPALEFLLKGQTETHQEMIRDAVYTLGHGDPESFTVRFAMLLQAHCLALNELPERLKQTLEAQSKDNLAQQNAIRKAAEAYTQVTTRQVNEIVAAIRDLQGSAEEERKTATQEWNNKIAELRRDYDDLRTQTKKLSEFKTHLFWSAIGGAVVLGLLLEGLLSIVMGWGR